MTTLQPATARPASFDALLLDHMTALRGVASYLSKYGADEIVADTVELALRRWANFDPEKGTFYRWLVWQARDAARRFRDATQEVWDNETAADLPHVAVAPVQEDAAMLSWLREQSGDRDVRAAILFATGHSSAEVAAIEGIESANAKYRAIRGRQKLRNWTEAA